MKPLHKTMIEESRDGARMIAAIVATMIAILSGLLVMSLFAI